MKFNIYNFLNIPCQLERFTVSTGIFTPLKASEDVELLFPIILINLINKNKGGRV